MTRWRLSGGTGAAAVTARQLTSREYGSHRYTAVPVRGSYWYEMNRGVGSRATVSSGVKVGWSSS